MTEGSLKYYEEFWTSDFTRQTQKAAMLENGKWIPKSLMREGWGKIYVKNWILET